MILYCSHIKTATKTDHAVAAATLFAAPSAPWSRKPSATDISSGVVTLILVYEPGVMRTGRPMASMMLSETREAMLSLALWAEVEGKKAKASPSLNSELLHPSKCHAKSYK